MFFGNGNSTMASERILVVDDELPIREILCAMLRTAGYRPEPASSGPHALLLLSRAPFDLVLSDLVMDGMDGSSLLKQLRSEHPDLPVIMVTAVGDISTALQSLRNGAYDYLLKPFEREQLIAIVRRGLDHNRLRVENRHYQQNLEALVTARTEQLCQTMHELERSYDITLEALGDALDLKDAETEGHSKRVTAFTIALARAMGMNSEAIRVIARAAFLHDIGKMAIPDAILRKPSALSREEIGLMREHCYRGYLILKKIPFLAAAADIVYSHQERFDGSGYPRGLRREAIPLGARLFAIADTLDAITSDRPYRAAQSFEAARKEIARHSGSQFDPELVNIFLRVPPTIWEDLRREIQGQINHFYSSMMDPLLASASQ